uniref:bifunctional cytidylyltransferase/SDR family oxidoreductase n=1 Tax=Pseudomonas sp. RW407 TaxID=2202894 RepID=UPI001C436DC6|nr:bifunctional cytidylyltransferase/SDR family oxidoreductase [Pseudomonas sp. RW407]
MNKPTKNIAVILAGGQGTRSKFLKPKQLMKLAGRPIVEHTIDSFNSSSEIDEIVIVSNRACIETIENIVLHGRFNKVKSIIFGGTERYESSLSAIQATEHYCSSYEVRLIFHDAVRPLISQRIIKDVVQALDSYNAVDVVVKTTDTIIVSEPLTNTISSIPDRSNLRNGQTPQAFSHKVIKKAYELARQDPNFSTTDDCGVILKYLPDEKIYLVEGDNSNIKLTYEEDLHILDKLCQLRSIEHQKIQNLSFSLSSLKEKIMVVFGGTSGIGEEIVKISDAYQAKVIPIGSRTGVDITNFDQVKKALADIYRDYKRIDYVVNTAAVLSKQPLIDMSSEEINRSILVNYNGAVNISVASFEYLRESQGQLLNFTSSSYTYGRALYSLYSSSKAAVVNLTQALADEWHSYHIRVNCINPERTATPMRTKAFGVEPIESLLSAKEVAERALLVLVSGHTGQIFDIKKL